MKDRELFHFYQEEYLKRHPTLDAGDAPIKFRQLREVWKPERNIQSLLDVGCGSGALLRLFARSTRSLLPIGSDLSSSILLRARQEDPSYQYVRADGRYLPFKNGSVDLAVVTDVLEHLSEPERLLQEVGRVSKRVLLSAPLESGWVSDRIVRLMERLGKETNRERFGHLHRWRKEHLDALLEGAEFFPFQKKVLKAPFSRYDTLPGKAYSLASRWVYRWAPSVHRGAFGGYTYLFFGRKR
jgi:ubiquinone/menaquinone biosynthesis C-methylase UbiE